MHLAIMVAMIPMLIGAVLIFLTRKTTYQALHERALQTNPAYRWTFPKSSKNQKFMLSLGRVFLKSIGILSLFVGVFVLSVSWYMHISPFQGDRFDLKQWEEAGSCQGLSDWGCAEKEASCPRGGMVHDLTTNHLVEKTTTRDQVIAMLGPSKYTLEINGAACPAYSLGMCSGIGIDYDSLYVCFDDTDNISSTGHVQH